MSPVSVVRGGGRGGVTLLKYEKITRGITRYSFYRIKFRKKSLVPNSIQHQKKSCKRGESNVGFQARKESSLPVHVVSTV